MKDGHVRRVHDEDIQSPVLEVEGRTLSTTFLVCPADASKTLAIKLPYLVLLVKNLDRYFSFEVQVIDDKGNVRRLRASNYQVRSTDTETDVP